MASGSGPLGDWPLVRTRTTRERMVMAKAKARAKGKAKEKGRAKSEAKAKDNKIPRRVSNHQSQRRRPLQIGRAHV